MFSQFYRLQNNDFSCIFHTENHIFRRKIKFSSENAFSQYIFLIKNIFGPKNAFWILPPSHQCILTQASIPFSSIPASSIPGPPSLRCKDKDIMNPAMRGYRDVLLGRYVAFGFYDCSQARICATLCFPAWSPEQSARSPCTDPLVRIIFTDPSFRAQKHRKAATTAVQREVRSAGASPWSGTG